MQELIGQVLTHLHSAWRFRWHAIACAWAIAVAGWTYVLMMPDIYEARARVYVDTDSVLTPLLNGLAVGTNVQNRVGMMSRALMSRPNLERVARETDLYLRAPDPEAFARLVQSLQQRIILETPRENIYNLRFSDSDPAMAQRVVQTLLDTFVEDTLGVKRADSDSAQNFIQEQIREYEQRLREAEDRLAKFKQDNLGMMPGEGGDYYARLQSSLQRVQDLRSQYRLAEQRRNEITKQLEGEEPTFGIFTGSAESGSSDPRVAAYRRELDQLLLQYTEKHPKVITLKETIANLEAQTAEKANAGRPAGTPPANAGEAAARALDINPVYQQLRIEQSRTQVQMAELREQISEQEGIINGLRSRVDTIPQIEAELTRLNRDYEVNKSQHQALLQRLESARLSEQAEASTENVKFRIMEPAVVPLVPTGPKRPLFMSAVFVLALGAGAVLAFGLSQLKPVFVSRAVLKDITGLQVLGIVSFLAPTQPKSLLQRESVLISGAVAALVFAFALSVTLGEPAIKSLRAILG